MDGRTDRWTDEHDMRRKGERQELTLTKRQTDRVKERDKEKKKKEKKERKEKKRELL